MKVALRDIHIAERVRQDLGDISALAESLERIGQLNPITVSQRNELIAGHRRVMAAEKLGWQYIEAHVVDMVDAADRLELELEENVHRKDFSPEELLEGYRRLDRLRRPSVARRIGRFFKSIVSALFGWCRPRRLRDPEHRKEEAVVPVVADDLYQDPELG
jgi:ParB family chromosome partitioning protein